MIHNVDGKPKWSERLNAALREGTKNDTIIVVNDDIRALAERAAKRFGFEGQIVTGYKSGQHICFSIIED